MTHVLCDVAQGCGVAIYSCCGISVHRFVFLLAHHAISPFLICIGSFPEEQIASDCADDYFGIDVHLTGYPRSTGWLRYWKYKSL